MAIVNIHLCGTCKEAMKEIDVRYDLNRFEKYMTFKCSNCNTITTKVFDVTPEEALNLWGTKNKEINKSTMIDLIKGVIDDIKSKRKEHDYENDDWDDPDDEIINR